MTEEQRAHQATKKKKQKKSYENPVRARKVRIYPTEDQKQGLNKLYGGVRFCYNLLVSNQKNVGQGGIGLVSFRKIVKDAHEKHIWLKEIPGEIKDVAVRDMEKARQAHFAKLKLKQQKDPNARHDAVFKFRSKKDPQQSFEVRGRDMVRNSGGFAFLKLGAIEAAEPLPPEVSNAVRFVRDRLGRHYLMIPREVTKKSENQAPRTFESVVSLDPGVRTFQTTYDVDGLSTEWGKGDMKDIFIACRKVDRLQSEVKRKRGSKKRGARRQMLRKADQIKNKVKEIHRKLALWLCQTYKVILIPVFESSQMVRKGKRKINAMTARNMLTWSHYGFRTLLKNKAELYPWVTVVECDEHYTSKTCGCCGEINDKLGGNKVFRCKKCPYVADRDINAARNILLRYLSLHCVSG